MSENGFEDMPDLRDALRIAMDEAGKGQCQIDYSRYDAFFDGIDATDEQKRKLIDALFHIGNLFYDAGFAYEITGWACGKLEESEDRSAAKAQDVVSSKLTTLSEIFNQCAA